VDYVVGLARNSRLETMLVPSMEQARAIRAITGKPARAFAEFDYQTRSGNWSRERRVVGKAEALCGKENPRYVVTTLTEKEWDARELYEDLYCARGEMENRIKEQLSLFAGRVSPETMAANRLRVYLAGMAYVLMSALRRIGLPGTEMSAGTGGDDPFAAAEDRCAGEGDGAAGVGAFVGGVSFAGSFLACGGAAALLKGGCLSGEGKGDKPEGSGERSHGREGSSTSD